MVWLGLVFLGRGVLHGAHHHARAACERLPAAGDAGQGLRATLLPPHGDNAARLGHTYVRNGRADGKERARNRLSGQPHLYDRVLYILHYDLVDNQYCKIPQSGQPDTFSCESH